MVEMHDMKACTDASCLQVPPLYGPAKKRSIFFCAEYLEKLQGEAVTWEGDGMLWLKTYQP